MRKFVSLAALVVASAPAWADTGRAKPVLPFIENDYGKAVARAKTKHVPLFVDAWAPW